MEPVPSEMIFNVLRLHFPQAPEKHLISLTQKMQTFGWPPRTRLDAPRFLLPRASEAGVE
jgi:hypothetical protein